MVSVWPVAKCTQCLVTVSVLKEIFEKILYRASHYIWTLFNTAKEKPLVRTRTCLLHGSGTSCCIPNNRTRLSRVLSFQPSVVLWLLFASDPHLNQNFGKAAASREQEERDIYLVVTCYAMDCSRLHSPGATSMVSRLVCQSRSQLS